jgi:hypothetical protein
MRAVELRVGFAAFGDALSGMRQWLDHHGCHPVKFEHSTEGPGVVLISVLFEQDDIAETFRRDFGGVGEQGRSGSFDRRSSDGGG